MKLKAVDLETLSLQLNQLSESLAVFENILDQEANTLKSPDISPLTEIVAQKQLLSEQLSECFDTLIFLLSDNPISLNEFMLLDSFFELPSELQSKFKSVNQQIMVCNDKNTANGLSVQALSSLNDTLIQLFKGQDLQSKTYTASGNASTSPSPTNPLGKA